MVALKLILLTAGLLLVAVGAIGIKLFFQKNPKMPATSCKAVGNELQKRGVEACGTNTCNDTEITALPRIETRELKL